MSDKTSATTSLGGWLTGSWFLMSLLGALAAGMMWPDSLAIGRRWPLVPDTLVFAVIFVTALPHDFGSIRATVRGPGPTMVAVFINAVVVPILAWPLSKLLPPALGLGLIVASAVPSTIASAAVWTRKAGGNDLIPLIVTSITNLLCFVVTPFWIWLLGGQRVEIGFIGLVVQLATLVLLPMMLAQFVRGIPGLAWAAERNRDSLSIAAQIGILGMVALGAAECGKQLQSGPLEGTTPWALARLVCIVVVLHGTALVIGQVLARRRGYARADWIAVGFAGSQKTLMVGLHTSMLLGSGPVMLPMVAYHVLQLVVDSWIAEQLARTSRADPTAAVQSTSHVARESRPSDGRIRPR
ncbi:MAG TPA: bile acid:sodium symporter [Pirellulaceae bacterium]